MFRHRQGIDSLRNSGINRPYGRAEQHPTLRRWVTASLNEGNPPMAEKQAEARGRRRAGGRGAKNGCGRHLGHQATPTRGVAEHDTADRAPVCRSDRDHPSRLAANPQRDRHGVPRRRRQGHSARGRSRRQPRQRSGPLRPRPGRRTDPDDPRPRSSSTPAILRVP